MNDVLGHGAKGSQSKYLQAHMKSLAAQLVPLKFLSLRLHMRADEPLYLPAYKGSTLRGAFGAMFKDTVCVVPHRDCTRCLLRSHCAYPYVFETPVPDRSTRMRTYPAAPHPFVILPSLEDRREYGAGDEFHFDLTLIGKGIDYLSYFIYTFAQFSEKRGFGKGRGKCTLASVQWWNASHEWEVVYTAQDQILRENFQSRSVADLDGSHAQSAAVTLQFETPTRIVHKGRLASQLHFHILVRTLLRRVSNLMYFHCDSELDLDFRALIDQSEEVQTHWDGTRWYDWERYSSRQHRHVKQGGLVGTVTYEGALQTFRPLLSLGEHLHVGKGTSFGLGKYRVV